MKLKKSLVSCALALTALSAVPSAQAAIIVADTVIEFFNSGANPAFPVGP
jgi:P pilus assembly chaperone PapD